MALVGVNGAGYRVPQGAEPALRNYLEERDYGPPSGDPGIIGHTAAPSAGGAALCEIQWKWEQAIPPLGLKADGFVIWIGYTTTALAEVPEPTIQGCKVSEGSRSYVATVPPGVAMRFGIQAYRNVHQGEFRTEKLWPASWICDNRSVCTRVLYHLPFLEAQNYGNDTPTASVQRTFTPLHPETLEPVTIHTIGGVPQASVFKGNSLMPGTKTTDPWEPPTGCWTLDGDGKVKTRPEDAPWPSDFWQVESAVVC